MINIFSNRSTMSMDLEVEEQAVSSNIKRVSQISQSLTDRNTTPNKEDKKKNDAKQKHKRDGMKYTEMNFARFKRECKLDSESIAYVTEDTRMSTLQRKLVRESNPVVGLGLALQISEVILYHENRGYVYRSSEVICDAIKEIFIGNKSGASSSTVNHGDAIKRESAKALGRVAYVLSDGSSSEEGGGKRNSKESAFDQLYDWLWKQYKSAGKENPRSCVYFLRSLETLFSLKPGNMRSNDVDRICKDLQEELEVTESPFAMMAIVDIFVVISWWRPNIFESRFQDIVDILVGWHIDSSQKLSVRNYTSNMLLGWQKFWMKDNESSMELLKQFIEDLTEDLNTLKRLKDDITKKKKTQNEIRDCLHHILAVMQVFNTVLSCLRAAPPLPKTTLGKSSLEWFDIILRCLFIITGSDEIGKECDGQEDLHDKCDTFDEDIFVTGQQAIMMLLEMCPNPELSEEPKSDCRALHIGKKAEIGHLLGYSFSHFLRFSCQGQICILNFTFHMSKLANEPGSQGQKQEESIIQLITNSRLAECAAFTRYKEVQEETANLYRHLLKSKNIIVLQEVYSHLTEIYEAAMMALANIEPFLKKTIANNKDQTKNNNDRKTTTISNLKEFEHRYTKKEAEKISLFVLNCLSDLVNGKGSVLSMWALEPSIFSLLINHSGLLQNEQKFLQRSPWIYETLIKMLITHCKCHNQFTSSSNLVTSNNAISHSSPTMKYFETILETVACLLNDKKKKRNHLSTDSLQLAIIGWVKSIFEEGKKFEKQQHMSQIEGVTHGIVLSNEKFRRLLFSLIDMSCNQHLNAVVAEPCLVLVKTVFTEFPLIGSCTQKVSECVRECALIHLRSTSTRIQDIACEIIGLLPPMIGHWTSNSDMRKRNNLEATEQLGQCTIGDTQNLKLAFLRNNHEELKPTDFKVLADYLFKKSGKTSLLDEHDKLLKHLEILSIQEIVSYSDDKTHLVEYITSNVELQAFWVGYQLAQFCVRNKLKTPLGKAQETLTTIEKVIRQLAADAAALSVFKPSPEENIPTQLSDDTKTLKLNVLEVRHLLTFFELLEKSMSNAWDGSAYHWAGPPGGKSITSFFTANKRTCHDWLSRLRVTVIQLAFYVGEYGFVVRNSFITLKNFLSTKKLAINTTGGMTPGATSIPIVLNATEELQFVHVIVLTALSLCKLKGSHNLHGLYVWCKENTGKKFRWILSLIDFVKHRIENGIKGFQVSLMHPAVLDSASYGDSTAGGALTFLVKEAYMFHAYLHEPMYPANQLASYEAQAEKYKQKITQSCSKPHTQTYLEALSAFDNGEVLTTYKDDESLRSDTYGSTLFRAEDILIHCHQLLLQAASCFQSGYGRLPSWKDSGKLPTSLKKSEDQLNLLLTDHRLLDDQFQQVLILKAVHNELNSLVENKQGKLGRFLSLVDIRNRQERLPATSQLVLIKKWGEFFTKYRKNNPKYYFQLSALNLEIAIVARKERNYRMSASYLSKTLLGTHTELSLKEYMRTLDLSSSLLSVERACSLRHAAKLVHVLGDADAGILSVQTLSGIATSIYSTYHFQCQQGQDTESSMTELLEISSRSLNSMSKWFKAEPMLLEKVYPEMISPVSDRSTVSHILQLEQNSPAPSIQNFLLIPDSKIADKYGTSINDNDMVIGRLLRLAVIQAPNLAKIWNNLANWSLDLGERTLAANEGNIIELNAEEKENIRVFLSAYNQVVDNSDLYEMGNISFERQQEQVINLFSQIKLKQSGGINAGETEKSDTMKKILREDCPFLKDAPAILLDKLQLIWEQVQKRVFFYHETAVNAYFQFLSRTENQQSEKIVNATLRLLQLTVRHALELQECLQEGLESTPSAKWRAIIPQLFSRLNHPVLSVRTRISELICRIASDYPHLIIYPAVVGSASTGDTDKFSNLLSTVVDDAGDENKFKNSGSSGEGTRSSAKHGSNNSCDEVNPEMQSAHAKIVEFIVKQRSGIGQKSVEQVKTVVYELQRISLLWDELWLGTLQQYGNEVNRRVKKMEEEIYRLDRNCTLSEQEKIRLVKEKYNIIFKPLIYILEKVATVTCCGENEPETPNEKSFANKYGAYLSNALPKLKEPLHPGKPKDVWGILHNFQMNLTNRLSKKSQLKLNEISTRLSNMKNTYVPLPGNDTDSSQGLFIDSFDELLTILPTKTKPKRLSVIANDGRKYTYLFKGLEDLHLDERIMQFLKIANIMMRKRGKGDYLARNYSVVPLGPRSGLIQWVEGAQPLYSLYKRWQHRQQSNDSAGKKTSETTSTPTAYQKPSDAFYGKLVPLLREKGITTLDNRKEWPIEILKEVYQGLATETPKNLLSQEIWYASTDSDMWFRLTENITRSFAVMSVIGYIIGLGDRHLDNLLVDLKSGEVIHIDYNCCFEKGKNLRIPERVPCRLTQNIVDVFGISGVNGVFRLSCEHVLETMRSGRETLLTLLEAFVYDPLVDWTPGIELGFAGAYQGGARQNLLVGQDMAQDKRDMQTEITFSMLSVRVSEIRGPWLENQTNLSAALAGVEDGLNLWLDVTTNIQQLNDYLTKLHHGMSILKEAEANPGHRLYSLQDRYIEHKMVEQAVLIAQEKSLKFIEENEKRRHLHQRALDIALTPTQLGKWTTDVGETKVVNAGGENRLASTKTSNIVKAFLENAGQVALLEQLQGIENVFGKGLEKLKCDLQTCLLLLGSYSTVTSLFPRSYILEHRNTLYVKWMSKISDEHSIESCHAVLAAFTAQFVDMALETGRMRQHHILNLNYQMESWTQEINFRLQNIYERMANEGIIYENGHAVIIETISQARIELQQYLQNEKCSTLNAIMGGVAVSKLAKLAKKTVELESLVHLNGCDGRFVDLSNSEWFLFDEIMMQNGYASQLMDAFDFIGVFSATQTPNSTSNSIKCLSQFDNAVKQLQNLNASFFAVILQEGLKCFLREDPSLISIAVELNDIVSSSELSLEDTIEELNIQIRYITSNIESSNQASTSAIAVANDIKDKYQKMVKRLSEGGSSNKDSKPDNLHSTAFEQGKMLFIAFNSLFDAVDNAMSEVKDTFSMEKINESWTIGIDAMSGNAGTL